MDKDDAKFDPGFQNLVIPFTDNIEACNGVIGGLSSPHQRKFKFQILFPQIYKLIENNVAFYYGCLLWAYFLVNNFKNNPIEIKDNPFIDKHDEIDMDEIAYNIDYLIKYIQKFENDTKYYLKKSANIDKKWAEILKLYKEFLMLNKGFKTTKLTSEIAIPNDFQINIEPDSIRKEIETAIDNRNIESLLKL